MIILKQKITIIFIFFLLTSLSMSSINFRIILKIDNQIVTTYDLEQERNYLLALNPRLNEVDEKTLLDIAKKSIVKEVIRKNEILKYKELNLQNSQINTVLEKMINDLNFSNLQQFQNYLMSYSISIDEIRGKIEIENEWKNLIYAKYSKSINIDKASLQSKIDNISEKEFLIEYNLSEIIFSKQNNNNLKEVEKKIFESINEIGFENTANLYSISDSAKVGGKIGWIRKDNLSAEVVEKLKNLKQNSNSPVIEIGNNYLILKINEIKETPVKIDKKRELEKMIMIETSKQLDKFSNIFYNKIKLNSKISEF
tara:strand:+ start:1384 stop:2319 length:936 start_codon:yes stop_codon:yes gene_type:complete